MNVCDILRLLGMYGYTYLATKTNEIK